MPSQYPIIFGTSGHRGIIGTSFTIDHIKAISIAIATLLNNSGTIAIGYDPREGNDPQLTPNSFTKICVDTLRSYGINVVFLTPFTPTPAVSWYVTQNHLQGGLILTASHNPPEYNGIKFNTPDGAPADTKTTTQIEMLANQYLQTTPPPAKKPGTLIIETAIPAFSAALHKTLTQLLGHSLTIQFPIVIDAKHGTAGYCWETLLKSTQSKLDIIHKTPDSHFGNINPNPTKIDTLTQLQHLQKTLNTPIAIANDPDSDRHVILDETGSPLTPEETTVIIGRYLLSKNIPLTEIISTVASSRLLKKFCVAHQLTYTETSVGFKYIATHLKKAKETAKIALGVESSGGFSASFHTLEKCGFLPGMILFYLLSETSTPLSQLKAELSGHYGHHNFQEIEFYFDPSQKQQIKDLISQSTIQNLTQKTKLEIATLNQEDGLKIILTNDDWLLIRLSGTEPIARIYAESNSQASTQKLLEIGKWFLTL